MDKQRLEKSLPSNCKLVIGEVGDTVRQFLAENDLTAAPIGFISFDLDYYYSTRDAMEILCDTPEKYLPHFPTYFDDIALWSHNEYCGELLAVKQFNIDNQFRKIEKNRFLQYRRVFKHSSWLEHIFFLHILDAPERTSIRKDDEAAVLVNPYFK